MGFRFDDGFVRHVFFGGRGIVFGGVFFGGPFTWGRRGESEHIGGFGRRIEPWGPWLRTGRTVEAPEKRPPGLFPRLAQAIRSVASGLGQVARLALGSGRRGVYLTHDLGITPDEARHGAKKQVRLARGTETEEVLVTIPAGVRPGTRLRLRGKGNSGAAGERGDLYLRIHLTE